MEKAQGGEERGHLWHGWRPSVCEGSWGPLDRRQPSREPETITQLQIQYREMEGWQRRGGPRRGGWESAERWRTAARRRLDLSPGR